MSNKRHQGEQGPAPAKGQGNGFALPMARGPQDYTPGQLEEPVVLTSFADMLHWAQNWVRSRSIDQLPAGPISTRTPLVLRPPRGETYFATESSKGELGV